MEAGHALSSPLGRITISGDAIARIVGETARECYGVVAMAGRKWLPDRPTRGIEIGGNGDGVTIDLHVVVEYGLNLAEVASTIRTSSMCTSTARTESPVSRSTSYVTPART